MPPVKTRLTIMVDPDVAKYFEEKWNEIIIHCIKEDKRKPSFSEYMNNLLKEYIKLEKAGKIATVLPI